MHYVSAQFDRIRNIDSYLSQDVWRECNRCLTRVVTALDSERGIKLGALKTDDIAATAILQKSLPKIKEELHMISYNCHDLSRNPPPRRSRNTIKTTIHTQLSSTSCDA